MSRRATRLVAAVLMLLGVGVGLYPPTAQWVAQRELAQLGAQYEVQTADLDRDRLRSLAVEYNEQLPGIASADPFGGEVAEPGSAPYRDYLDQLTGDSSGQIGQLAVPSVGIDLPVFHGTSEDTLRRGVGHLFGSSLPVGGKSTHAVLTAHSGLADAKLFTDLHRVQIGDTFDIRVLGRTNRYRVETIITVTPGDSSALAVQPGRDMVTLVTCTPVGVNSHRLLVTGSRIPTEGMLSQPMRSGVLPDVPWWLFAAVPLMLAMVAYGVWPQRRPG